MKKHKNLRRGSLVIMLILTLVIVSLPMQPLMAAEGDVSRTIMLYGCGADLEESGFLSSNIKQILSASASKNTNFVILTGGAKEWKLTNEYLEDADSIDPDKHQIWSVVWKNGTEAHGKLKLLGELESLVTMPPFPDNEKTSWIMSDYQMLQKFTEYSKENFSADRYDLILWDHGGGPLSGFAVDKKAESTSDDEEMMPVSGIAKALKATGFTGENRLELLNFDACIMGSAEIIGGLSSYAENIVASPDALPGYGQEYSGWLNGIAENSSVDGYSLSKSIVDSTTKFYEDQKKDELHSILTAYNSDAFTSRLAPKLVSLMSMMCKEAESLNYYDELYSLYYSYTYYDRSCSLYDIGDLCANLSTVVSEYDKGNLPKGRENDYTKLCTEIRALMADTSIMYSRRSNNYSIQQSRGPALGITRAANGELIQTNGEATPCGLSLYLGGFYTLVEISTLPYDKTMANLIAETPDGNGKKLIGSIGSAATQYQMIVTSGQDCAQIYNEKKDDTKEEDIVTKWHKKPELTPEEIEQNRIAKENDPELSDEDLPNTIPNPDYNDWEYEIVPEMEHIVIFRNAQGENPTSVDDLTAWLKKVVDEQLANPVNSDQFKVVGTKRTGSHAADGYIVEIGGATRRDIQDMATAVTLPLTGDYQGYDLVLDEVSNPLASSDMIRDCEKDNTLLHERMYKGDNISYAFDKPVIEKWYFLKVNGEKKLLTLEDPFGEDDNYLYFPAKVRYSRKKGNYYFQGYLVGKMTGDTVSIEGFMNKYELGATRAASPIYPIDSDFFDDSRIATCGTMVNYEKAASGYKRNFKGMILADYTNLDDKKQNHGFEGIELKPISELSSILPDIFPSGTTASSERIYSQLIDTYGYQYVMVKKFAEADSETKKGNYRTMIDGDDFTISLNKNQTYTGKPITPAVTVKDPQGNTLKENTDYEVYYSYNTDVGDGTATIYGVGKYTGMMIKFFTITKKQKLTSATLSRTSLTYNAKTQKVSVKNVKAGSKTVPASNYTVTGASGKNAGTYKVTIKAKANSSYTGTITKTFKIKQAKTTVSTTKSFKKSALKKSAKTAVKISTVAAKKNITVSTSGTKKTLKKYISISSDKKTVKLKKGAKSGTYKITIKVSGGGAKTYSNLSKRTYTIKVK